MNIRLSQFIDYAKWQMLLAEKKASIDGRIQAALDRQKSRKNA